MAALAADLPFGGSKDGRYQSYPVGASKEIFKGGMVCVDAATGYAEAATDAAGKTFVGTSTEHVNNTGSAGAKRVLIDRDGIAPRVCAGFGQGDVGLLVFIEDDQTVQKGKDATHCILAGRVTEFISATKVMVDQGEGTRGKAEWHILTSSLAGAVGHAAEQKADDDLELSFAATVKRIFVTALTAPGASMQCDFVIAQSSASKTVSLLNTGTKAEDKAVEFDLTANKDFTMSFQDTAATGATADVRASVHAVRTR